MRNFVNILSDAIYFNFRYILFTTFIVFIISSSVFNNNFEIYLHTLAWLLGTTVGSYMSFKKDFKNESEKRIRKQQF